MKPSTYVNDGFDETRTRSLMGNLPLWPHGPVSLGFQQESRGS